jgi:hypothetical protein
MVCQARAHAMLSEDLEGSTMSGNPPKNGERGLDMGKVQSKLDRLLLALGNKLEREQLPPAIVAPAPARAFLLVHVQLARSTFRAICYVCADKRLKEYDWRWEHTLILPPLNRTILDSVFSVVFMLEDVGSRWRWYHESGFREASEELDRYKEQYGGMPEWEPWLQRYAEMLMRGRTQFGITLTASTSKKPKWWPNPGKMPNMASRAETRDFLLYLNDWFYREMSSQTHLSFAGVMKLGGLIVSGNLGGEKREEAESVQFPAFRAHQVTRTVTLLLCLTSEIERYFGFGLQERLLELWLIVIESVPEAKEVFDKRYSGFWPHALVSRKD